MIDTAKLEIYMTDRIAATLRRMASTRKFFLLIHPYQLSNVRVYFNIARRKLWLESSLPKLLQGHNVFGSNRLEKLCLQVISLIYKQLGVKYTKDDEHIIREEGIRLMRLDITCSFVLDSPTMVDQTLEQIYEQFRAEGKAWSAYGSDNVETVYNQQRSTRVTDKFYNKGKELALPGRSVALSTPQRQRLIDFSDSLLRFEVTLRGKELRELELDYADDWDAERVKNELSTRLRKLKLKGAIQTIPRNDVPLKMLTASEQTFLGLWSDGASLRKYRKNRTVQRARQRLLKRLSIDIYRAKNCGSPIPLKTILDPSLAYFTAPKFLVSGGAIFDAR